MSIEEIKPTIEIEKEPIYLEGFNLGEGLEEKQMNKLFLLRSEFRKCIAKIFLKLETSI